MFPMQTALQPAQSEKGHGFDRSLLSRNNGQRGFRKTRHQLRHGQKKIHEFRRLLLPLLENAYASHREEIVEYDEYLYLDHAKRKEKKYIFDAHNFLTFDYGGKVYNILMPSLDRYKSGFLADGLADLYYDEFSRFLKIHRIAKLRSIDNTIVMFWKYFDEFMKKYKGIRPDNFIYYLKEAEFKFNHPMPERFEILKKVWFES